MEAAQGRWREILPALGVARGLLNGRHQPCPMCGGKDRFRWDDNRGDGNFFCSQCGPGTGFSLLKRLHGWDFGRAAAEVDKIIGTLPEAMFHVKHSKAASPDDLNRLWRAGVLVAGNLVAERYFRRRGLNLALSGYRAALRLHPALNHKPTGTKHPCLLARFSNAQGAPRQIHRTYLSAEGTKADVEPCRMFMPGSLPEGGAIRLGDEAEAMGVAEGIETALSASVLFGVPVWATTSESMLQKWSPPAIARRVTIFGDADASYAGQAAAFALAKRLVFEAVKARIERAVEVCFPPTIGQDWNDVLIARGAADGEIATEFDPHCAACAVLSVRLDDMEQDA